MVNKKYKNCFIYTAHVKNYAVVISMTFIDVYYQFTCHCIFSFANKRLSTSTEFSKMSNK